MGIPKLTLCTGLQRVQDSVASITDLKIREIIAKQIRILSFYVIILGDNKRYLS